tara:strand:+ start:768 stop:1013 length:246 start_codon:yes stop_codon:yes gene_type:complete
MNVCQIRKKNIIIFLKGLLCFYFLSLGKAYAYLDPGTGSIILQAILAAIAAIGATSSFYWEKIKSKFKILLKKKDSKDKKD